VSQEQRLPEASEVLISTAASLVNLAGIRLTEEEHKDVPKAKEAIDAARAILPLCPEDAIAPIKEALSQIQMLYVKESDNTAHARAEARSKIWTPPGS
jgi:Na+-transporting NADH:ubiquinone oxidoreductase subunit NqrC